MLVLVPDILRDSERPCCTHDPGCPDPLTCAILAYMAEPLTEEPPPSGSR